MSLILMTVGCGGAAERTEDISIEDEEDKPFSENDAKALYSLRCASCHGPDGKLGLSGAKDLSLSKLTDSQIGNIIQNGKNAMPPFKELIPENQQEVLVTVVKSLRK